MAKTRIPTTPAGKNLAFNFPINHSSFDLQAFDDLIRTQGILVKHLRAMPDPRGLNGRGDYRRNQPESNSDGLIYKSAGCFTAIFQTNGKDVEYVAEGEVDQSQAYMTPPKFYDGSEEPVIINVFDRFELQNIELRVVVAQLVETSSIGRDRLNFPVMCVEHLIGANGVEYKENVHFKINQEGEIEWISQDRPGHDLRTGKGEVYSIRYRYMPYFVVRRIIHEIRVAQVTDIQSGKRYVERLPYQVVVARENVYRDKQRVDNAPVVDSRFQDEPPYGGEYGPQGG